MLPIRMKTILATLASAALFASATTQIHATAFPRNPIALLILVFAAATLTAAVALRCQDRQCAPNTGRGAADAGSASAGEYS